MTQEEFNNASFTSGDKAIYQGKECPIVQIDFLEQLFGIDFFDDTENLSWVRCENVEYIPLVQATK